MASNFLVEKYAGALHSIVSQILTEENGIAETLEEAFKRITHSIDEYDESKSRLFTWMLRITRETALQKLKNRISRTSDVYREAWAENSIGEALKKLSSEEQELVHLSYFKGYSPEDVAKQLDMSPEVAKRKIKAALFNLNTLL